MDIIVNDYDDLVFQYNSIQKKDERRLQKTPNSFPTFLLTHENSVQAVGELEGWKVVWSQLLDVK